jgi:cell division protein FtsQ
MKVYNQLAKELDSGGAHYTQDLSEVDLSDTDDVKVMANDPSGQVLVHLGSSDFLDRYKIFVSHVREWRQQFAKLDSVDLRYENQIVVNPDLRGMASAAPASLPAEKPAALIAKEGAAKAPAKNGGKAHAAKHPRKAVVDPAKAKAKPAAAGTVPVVPDPSSAPPNNKAKPTAVQPPVQGNTAPPEGSKPSPVIPKGP